MVMGKEEEHGNHANFTSERQPR
jgi:hypothetical protein